MSTSLPTIPVARRGVAVLRDRAFRIAELMAAPHAPSDFVDLVSPLSSDTDLRGRIVAITRETVDAATITIEPGRTWQGHIPGQYIRIGVDIAGVRHRRAYSVTSPPWRRDGAITITVKAIRDGLVSNHLVRDARIGTIIQLDQACGDFTLGGRAVAKALFVTGGSGITPVMGMLRSCRHQLRDVVLIHSAPTAEDVIFRAELRRLHADRRIRLIELHTDIDGMLDVASLASLVPDLEERETWGCGPIGLLDELEQHLDQVHTERFRPSVIVPGDGGRVTFSRAGIDVEADGATPLLTVGEAAGVLMPSGCRMGICRGCVVPLREGAVRDLRTGELTTALLGDDIVIQTCVSAAAGTCHIDL